MIESIMMIISSILLFLCGLILGVILADKLNSEIIESLTRQESNNMEFLLQLTKELIHLNECNEKYEHELTSINGLYVADNPEFKDSWRLDFQELLKDNHNVTVEIKKSDN